MPREKKNPLKDKETALPKRRARQSGSPISRSPTSDEQPALSTGNRIAVEAVNIEIDCGRFQAKVVAGRPFVVEADIFSDGHDAIACAFLWRKPGAAAAAELPMEFLVNNRWRVVATFPDNDLYECSFIGWRDLFATWRDEVAKKRAAGLDVRLELDEGRLLLESALSIKGLPRKAKRSLQDWLTRDSELGTSGERFALMGSAEVAALMRRSGPRTDLTPYRWIPVFADREAAAFSAWYELMPRSQSADPHRHGTFDDVIARLPYVRDLGFDVLYFPPIHPIGRTNRKGRNNSLKPAPDDPGSPYAIGSEEGGHDAIHPELGGFDDFSRLVAAAGEHGLEIALDFAIQCSPDHPWIRQHPEWFDWRPDGTIRFAENPPKKYEDIVSVHFYGDAFPGLWYALRDIVLFWIGHGVRIFRVDNPHTKPFPFWEWMIAEVRARHPDVIFLSEAFTAPKVMKRLAKVGFSQSYSYFTWRNEKGELEDYLTELTKTECRHYMRPNFFTNTPDINPVYLQHSGRPGFRIRLVLAATLAGNYGIYNGFEACEAAAVPGKEEYIDSEKYQIRVWDMDRPGNIQEDIRLVNQLRREHSALQDFTSLEFYKASSNHVLYYGKRSADLRDFLLFHVNLDPQTAHTFTFEVPLWEFGLPDEASVEVKDVIHGDRFTWHGKVQTLKLDPVLRPYAIWQLLGPGVPR